MKAFRINFKIKVDDIKRCSKCGIISLESNFHRKLRSKDGLTPHCKPCRKIYRKKYRNEHYDSEIIRRRKYRDDNEEKTDYIKKGRIRSKL